MRDLCFAVAGLAFVLFAIAALGMAALGCGYEPAIRPSVTRAAPVDSGPAPAAAPSYAPAQSSGPVQASYGQTGCDVSLCDESVDLTGIGDVELHTAAALIRGKLATHSYRDEMEPVMRRRLRVIDDVLIQRSKKAHPRGRK